VLIIAPLIFSGVVWRVNLCLPDLGIVIWGVLLFLLLLGSLFYTKFSLFYYVTYTLKLTALTLKLSLRNLNSRFHLFYFFSWVLILVKWEAWTLMVLIILILFL
jgi:hypothetical protein